MEQYEALVKAIPAVNAELLKDGTVVADPEGDGPEPEEAAVAAKKPTKKQPPPAKKANIEATSDEASD